MTCTLGRLGLHRLRVRRAHGRLTEILEQPFDLIALDTGAHRARPRDHDIGARGAAVEAGGSTGTDATVGATVHARSELLQ
ncbi:MAG: hypothetical protein AAGC67_21080, partial [Myxococcota bacterium]